MITVAPLKPGERPRCAYCGKGMLPNHSHRKMFVNQIGNVAADDPRSAEAQFVDFKTNRRVIQVRRTWTNTFDSQTDEPNGKTVYRIDITFLPDDWKGWGYDGLFCSAQCGRWFAHAAHKAGYRMKTSHKAA